MAMNNTSVDLIKYSAHPDPRMKPLACFMLRYPRIIHAEVMTHRVLSRNASSSRAIPTSSLSVTTVDDMFVPLFRKNKPGMQPGEWLSDEEQSVAERVWRKAADDCLYAAQVLADKDGLNIHKQWTNRMLEWFGYINVLVSGTDFENFFALRRETNSDGYPIAQDEIFLLANEMERQLKAAKPRGILYGEWHLPFVDDEAIIEDDKLRLALEMSVAKSASVSFKTVDDKDFTQEAAGALHAKLKNSQHWSPFEHQATPVAPWGSHEVEGNFDGWAQYRHELNIPWSSINR